VCVNGRFFLLSPFFSSFKPASADAGIGKRKRSARESISESGSSPDRRLCPGGVINIRGSSFSLGPGSMLTMGSPLSLPVFRAILSTLLGPGTDKSYPRSVRSRRPRPEAGVIQGESSPSPDHLPSALSFSPPRPK